MNDPRFPWLNDPEEAAAYWLVRHDAGLSATEELEFAEWLNQSEEHRTIWNDVSDLWDGVAKRPDPILETMRKEALRARRERPTFQLAGIALAACLCLVLVFSINPARFLSGPSSRQPAEIAMNAPPTYATAAGERREVSLADGSRVLLDANSAIAVRFTDAKRDIRLLRGQAFFEVAHNATRVFAVAARDSLITDTGTKFAVTVDPRQISAILAEGKVLVTRKGYQGQVSMKPGQQLRAPDGADATLSNVDVDAALAWREGFLIFNNTPLDRAIVEVNRYAPKPIRLQRSGVGTLQISGRFHTGDAEGFARLVADIHGLQLVHNRDGTLTLK